MGKFIDKSGQTINGFKVIRFDNFKTLKAGNKRAVFLVNCKNCGNNFLQESNRIGKQGCGCQIQTNQYKIVHGRSQSVSRNDYLYRTWLSMKNRCYRKADIGYKAYGGRGIIVCNTWRHSFVNFMNDMGERPTKEHSIDRIKNDEGYNPSNCRWATKAEQARNRRSTKLTKQQADQIRDLHNEGLTYDILADAFGVSKSNIGLICRGKRWN